MNLWAVGRLLCERLPDYRNPLAAPAGGHAFVQEPSPRMLECPRRAYWSNGPEATTCKEGKGGENSAWRAWVSTARPCAYIYSMHPPMLHQDSEDGLVCKVHGAPHGSFKPKTVRVDGKVHRHHELPLLCTFLQTAISEADKRTVNHVRVYA